MDISGSPGISALQAGLKRCPACGALHRLDKGTQCRRCDGPIPVRRVHSLQRAWAFLLVGMLAYIPANLFPIMLTRSLTDNTSDTILSGVIALAESGSYVVAVIVFVASICIPITKFVVIGGLALSLHFDWTMSFHTRHRLHTLTEFIGRWSMIDVFVVAVLAALIQLGAILSISPGVGIKFLRNFRVFTMLAASSLDSRLLWDHTNNGK